MAKTQWERTLQTTEEWERHTKHIRCVIIMRVKLSDCLMSANIPLINYSSYLMLRWVNIFKVLNIFKLLFFLFYVKLWCERVRPEYLPVIYNDVHSPGKFRVNVVLANFQSFADSFKCFVNSTMNPKDKCILW